MAVTSSINILARRLRVVVAFLPLPVAGRFVVTAPFTFLAPDDRMAQTPCPMVRVGCG
jgi:hypothetical protein